MSWYNPLTSRKINKDGATYRRLVQKNIEPLYKASSKQDPVRPKMIGSGVASCVYYPPLRCLKQPPFPTSKMVMKVQNNAQSEADIMIARVFRERMAESKFRDRWVLTEDFLCNEIDEKEYTEYRCENLGDPYDVAGTYLPYSKGIEFHEYRKGRVQFPSLHVMLHVFHDLLKSVQELHRIFIYHQDLHGFNILVDTEEWKTVILDFGIAHIENKAKPQLARHDFATLHKLFAETVDNQHVSENNIQLESFLEVVENESDHADGASFTRIFEALAGARAR